MVLECTFQGQKVVFKVFLREVKIKYRAQAWTEWPIDRQNHDLDVTTICATIECHDRQYHEILCRL